MNQVVRRYRSGMEIVPDTKDWTWVLYRSCPECGLDTRRVAATDVPGMLLSGVRAWHRELSRKDVRERPRPNVWSPLEYACHLRDVCLLFQRRLSVMLYMDDPEFADWDQDAAAIEDRYAEQDPAEVSAELGKAARILAEEFQAVSGAQWQRTGVRGDGAAFTVETFARYFSHELVHHLYDVVAGPAAPN